MGQNNVVVRFENVAFGYSAEKPLLDEANFSVRENTKLTLMGQNGAGKSTIFKLITGELKPVRGNIHLLPGATIATAKQVMAREHLTETVRDYFAHAFTEAPYNINKRIADALEAVNFSAPLDKTISDFSGGQQARLLLAFALIQEPDILLLDEPTNNLERDGIDHLTAFLIMYPKTVLVISHDADFLNSFTEGVLHLDVFTGKVEKYDGNYTDVVEEISARVERDRMLNARLLKDIQDRKDKVNFFANKGGKMRKLASKLREQVEDAESNMVEIRRDDKTIRDFLIPAQEYSDALVKISSVKVIRNHEPLTAETDVVIRKGDRLLVSGPNGIGKSTLLRTLTQNEHPGATIGEDVKIGYSQQDFSGLDFNATVYDALEKVMAEPSNEQLRATASEFLLTSDLLKNNVG